MNETIEAAADLGRAIGQVVAAEVRGDAAGVERAQEQLDAAAMRLEGLAKEPAYEPTADRPQRTAKDETLSTRVV